MAATLRIKIKKESGGSIKFKYICKLEKQASINHVQTQAQIKKTQTV